MNPANLSDEEFMTALHRAHFAALDQRTAVDKPSELLFWEQIGLYHYSIVFQPACHCVNMCYLPGWAVYVQDLNRPADVPENQWEGKLIDELCADSLDEAKQTVIKQSMKHHAQHAAEAFAKLQTLK